MSEDWLVRGPRPIEFVDIVGGLANALPTLSIRADTHERYVVVLDAKDIPLAWITPSREIVEPQKSARALGLPATDDAALVYWTEVTANHGLTTETGTPSEDIAAAAARGLADEIGGRADRWSASARTVGDPTTPGDTVPDTWRIPRDDCPLDHITTGHSILIQSRPVVPLTMWIVEAVTWAVDHSRTLTLLTPNTTDLTLAAADYLRGFGAHWVVDTDDGPRDGFTGTHLRWDGDGFTPRTPQGTDDPTKSPTSSVGLHLVSEAMLDYGAETILGPYSAAVAVAADLGSLTACGVLEPAEAAYDHDVLTTAAQQVSPNPLRLVVTGPAASGTFLSLPEPVGVVERIELTGTATATEWTEPKLRGLAEALLDLGTHFATVGLVRRPSLEVVTALDQGDFVPLLTVARLDRYPTLDLAVARAEAPVTAQTRVLETPAAALVVTYTHPSTQTDAGVRRDLRTAPADEVLDALTHQAQLLALLNAHDAHQTAPSP